MGRPKGVATERKEFRLESRQVEVLNALIATASLGRPTLVSLVRQAVDEFIANELKKADVRERVDRHLKDRRRVVNLHEIRGDS